MIPGFSEVIAPRVSVWIQFILAAPVVIWGGYPFFVRGVQSVKNASPNMFTLIAIGTGAAFIYSLFALFAPGLFPKTMADPHTGLIPGLFRGRGDHYDTGATGTGSRTPCAHKHRRR